MRASSAVRAERLKTTKSSGGSARGVAGVESNIRPAGGSGGGGGSSNDEVTETDYLNSETVREMEERMGAITRLTVAVMVDLTPPTVAEGQPTPKMMTTTEAEALIRNAIGFKTGRDSITVADGPFGGPIAAGPEPDEETARIQRMASYVELARNISAAVAVAMVLVVGLLLVIRGRRKPATTATTTPAAEPTTPEGKRQALLDRFLETARSDPDRTAAVFGLLVGPAVG